MSSTHKKANKEYHEPIHMAREITHGIHVLEASQRFFGLEVGARMTVLKLGDDLLIHSPVEIDPSAITHLGNPRWVLAPNLFHHLYIKPFSDAGMELWAAPGLPEKRADINFSGVIEHDTHPFGEDIQVLPLECFPMTNEIVLLHRPSRTLVVCDLVFNLPPTAPWLTRTAMRCLCGYPGCSTTLIERVGIRRQVARHELGIIANWDFDRVIMAHGDIIETGGKKALIDAFGWLF